MTDTENEYDRDKAALDDMAEQILTAIKNCEDKEPLKRMIKREKATHIPATSEPL